MKRIALSAALVLLGTGSALAQPRGGDAAEAAERTEFTFLDGERIEGSSPGASGIRVDRFEVPGQGSLLEARTSFVPQMLKSVEDL